MATPLDILASMMDIMALIKREAGGEVLRGSDPEGNEVFIHVSPGGDLNQVQISGDPVQDLYHLRTLVAQSSGLADA